MNLLCLANRNLCSIRKWNHIPAVFKHNFCSTSSGPVLWPEWQLPDGYDTGIKVYNSAAKAKVPLITNQPGLLTWYMCGPTVYDSTHIGHGICYVKFDIIRRILTDYFNINVIQVMGITDIDDKIIQKANYFKVNTEELSRHFEAEFWRAMSLLGVRRPSLSSRVTDHVEHIIEFVQQILNAGFAYQVKDGSVYFNNIAYRKTRGLGLPSDYVDTDTSGEPLADKQHPIDFALWKSATKGGPSWSSPFGPGRPGWHIECSAMASSVFGRQLDVHSGGVDLWFPHHYCEEAQCCTRHCSSTWTNYWWHSGHLSINHEKMSKSIGNVISVDKILESYSADTFRFYALSNSLGRESRFHNGTLSKMASQVNTIQNFLDSCHHFLCSSKGAFLPPAQQHPLMQELERTKLLVDTYLRDSFYTKGCVRVLMNLVSYANTCLNANNQLATPPHEHISSLDSKTQDTLKGTTMQGEDLTATRELQERLSSLAEDNLSTSSSSEEEDIDEDDRKHITSESNSLNFCTLPPMPVGRYEVAAVRNYILKITQLFGLNFNTRQPNSGGRVDSDARPVSELETRFPDVMKALLTFRQRVRDRAMLRDMEPDALAKLSKDEKKALMREHAGLMQASDDLRDQLKASSIVIKDLKGDSSWVLSEGIPTKSNTEKDPET